MSGFILEWFHHNRIGGGEGDLIGGGEGDLGSLWVKTWWCCDWFEEHSCERAREACGCWLGENLADFSRLCLDGLGLRCRFDELVETLGMIG